MARKLQCTHYKLMNMKTIKFFLSLVCLFGVLSVNAQEATVKPVSPKSKMTKIKVNKEKQTLNTAPTKDDKKAVNKTDAKAQQKATTNKAEPATDKTKMKSINKPVKVNKK